MATAATVASGAILFGRLLRRRHGQGQNRSLRASTPEAPTPSHKRDIGILLVNLGTPESTRPSDVSRFLKEFLTDGRVIDSIPWLARQFLVKCIIAPRRHRDSARNYEMIWEREKRHTSEGSPLMYHSQWMKNLLQKVLNGDTAGETHLMQEEDDVASTADAPGPFVVELGMNYGRPTIEEALERLHHDHHVKQIVVVPFFPQYASVTVGSIHEKVMRIVSQWQTIPNMSFISSFAMHHDYIDSVVKRARSEECMQERDHDHYVFSFHGVPMTQIYKADITRGKVCCAKEPKTGTEEWQCCQNEDNMHAKWFCYPSQCIRSSAIIAKELGIPADKYTVCFQSRLGKAEWMQPYLVDAVHTLSARGNKKLCVFSLSFTNECVETLHEIGIELRDDFIQKGGERLDVISSLNEFPDWVQSLKNIVLEFTNHNLIDREGTTWHH